MKKKLFIVLMMLSMTMASHAQFIQYQPVIPERQRAQAQQEQMYAYIYTSNGWQRIRIKVAIPEYGNAYVSAYIPPKNNSNFVPYTPAGSSPWRSSSAPVYDVSRSDGDYIYRNFDYKAQINGVGTIYF